jgi:hypothetical protein
MAVPKSHSLCNLENDDIFSMPLSTSYFLAWQSLGSKWETKDWPEDTLGLESIGLARLSRDEYYPET